MHRPSESVVRSSLYNWLGFGNLNGKYWFVGREESISLSKCEGLDTWDDYFERRAGFDLATDFRWTWEEEFGRPLSTFGTTTWHYQIAFLLALHGHEVTSSHVKRVLANDPQFCRTFSDHFSGEFFPCPKSSKSTIEPYSHIWDSVADYHEDVTDGRRRAFVQALEENRDTDLIITYSPSFVSALTEEYPTTELARRSDLAMDPIMLSKVELSAARTVHLLETPFLGYGRIGYGAIENVIRELPAAL